MCFLGKQGVRASIRDNARPVKGGRGTRKARNKPTFTMFDFVGVSDYHGDDDDFAWASDRVDVDLAVDRLVRGRMIERQSVSLMVSTSRPVRL